MDKFLWFIHHFNIYTTIFPATFVQLLHINTVIFSWGLWSWCFI